MVTYEVPHADKNIYLHKKLDKSLKFQSDQTLNDNQDSVIVCDGPEGSGKSQTARQIGWLLSKWSGTSFGMDNVHNDVQDYIDASLGSGPGTVHILDEGKELSSKDAMKKKVKRFENYMSENRNDNQYHIICIPRAHDLERNIAKHRLKIIINHIKKSKETDDDDYMSGRRPVLGMYRVFSQGQSWKYHYDKKNYSYPDQWYCRDRMNDCEVFNDEQLERYEKQKDKKKEEKYGSDGSGFASKTTRVVGACLRYLKDESLMSKACEHNDDILETPKRTFRYHVNKWIDEQYDAEEAASKQ
jgi:hypothetical protein